MREGSSVYPSAAVLGKCYDDGRNRSVVRTSEFSIAMTLSQPAREVLFGDGFAADGSEPPSVQAQSLWSMESWRMASVYYGSASEGVLGRYR